ncbi:MAG: hypothetical protein LUC85_06310 [Bacteroidales bacterium]|nr:hypothetical protein [Bacteroidales bacterium]MCD8394431.1 hypothetical protein [Bacteroidales bacterium]
MKKIVLALSLISALTAGAVDIDTGSEDWSASITGDLVTSYVWRGQQLGGFSIQPGLEVGYKGISLAAWGSTSWEDKWNREFDLTLGYSIKGFSVSVTDYWFSRTGDGVSARYFTYGTHSEYCSHVFEAHLGYDFGFLTADWYTNFAGQDGVDHHGHRAYSSYVTLAAPFSGLGIDWEARVGATPYCTTFYNNANSFAVTEVSLKASREVTITEKIHFPVWVQVIVNPRASDAYFVAGVSF